MSRNEGKPKGNQAEGGPHFEKHPDALKRFRFPQFWEMSLPMVGVVP